MARVLIIDDEEKLRKLLGRIVSLEGFEVTEASTAKAALKKLEQQSFEVILCDVKLPDGNGVELVKELKSISPATEVIMLTAYGTIADGVQAMRNGAFDYIMKGNDNDKIIPLLHRALEKAALQRRVERLEKKVKRFDFDQIHGQSPLLEQAITLARKVAATNTTVLLSGETGTGKEIFAHSIHESGSRKQQAFVALNCSAISREIMESELFGYKAGAFTGAVKDKKGLLEEAEGGTLFLDEVGEMPLGLQAKFLRVLENGEYIRPGDTKTVKSDVRLIAATNRDLQEEIQSGNFRKDLYYRLSVFNIQLPALRERRKDIPALAESFLKKFAAKTNKSISGISPEALQKLMQYDYPGNIRELKNMIERAVILCNSTLIGVDELPLELQLQTTEKHALSAFDLSSVEKLHIQKVLNYTRGNKTEAARLMNIGLTTLYRKIEEYGIQ